MPMHHTLRNTTGFTVWSAAGWSRRRHVLIP